MNGLTACLRALHLRIQRLEGPTNTVDFVKERETTGSAAVPLGLYLERIMTRLGQICSDICVYHNAMHMLLFYHEIWDKFKTINTLCHGKLTTSIAALESKNILLTFNELPKFQHAHTFQDLIPLGLIPLTDKVEKLMQPVVVTMVIAIAVVEAFQEGPHIITAKLKEIYHQIFYSHDRDKDPLRRLLIQESYKLLKTTSIHEELINQKRKVQDAFREYFDIPPGASTVQWAAASGSSEV